MKGKMRVTIESAGIPKRTLHKGQHVGLVPADDQAEGDYFAYPLGDETEPKLLIKESEVVSGMSYHYMHDISCEKGWDWSEIAGRLCDFVDSRGLSEELKKYLERSN